MILAFFCSSASLLMSLNTSSISSSVLPAVSGMHKNVKKKASRQKTAKKVYAPAPVFWIRGGVMRPYNRLASQCNTRRKKTTYDEEVVEPVGASRERDALCSQRAWENLRWHGPRNRSPRCSE
jgi:hypothetical protein